jgi:Na+-driven multidrug efflux pump
MRGALRGAGDTRWPFYGTIAATYLVRLPVTVLALPAGYALTLGPVTVAPGLGWGLPAVYAAILLDLYLKAGVNTARFASGRWRAVARSSKVGTTADD